MGAATGGLLASLAWTVQVLGTILLDKIKSEATQGYQLFVIATDVATIPVGTSIIPALASIAVTIALPPVGPIVNALIPWFCFHVR